MEIIEMYPKSEDTYTFAEVANEIGISEHELVEFAFSEGLIDEYGMPTNLALEQGFLSVEKIK